MSSVSARIPARRATEYVPGLAATGSTATGWTTGGIGGAIAASSSRTSIRTGHQVMQRPQPTQPELPNWSHQLENLWVSHWR